MIQIILRRVAFKIAFRGAVCMSAVAGYDAVPYVDMRGKLSCQEWPQRKAEDVTTLVIHHTAGGSFETPQTISEYHRLRNKWACIGYTWTIDDAGVVVQCNSLTDKANHAKNNNSHTAGLALIGNFDEHQMSEAMKASARAYVADIKRVHGIKRVVFHCDLKATACPGRHAIAELIDIHS